MKNTLILLLLLIGSRAAAKHPPQWKEDGFQKTPSGLQYRIIKQGRGDSIGQADFVWTELCAYKRVKGKLVYTPDEKTEQKTPLELNDSKLNGAMVEAIRLLKKGGRAFLVFYPGLLYQSQSDTAFFLLQVKKVVHMRNASPVVYGNKSDAVTKDSINFVLADPDKDKFGDTLFTSAKLLEAPRVIPCGLSLVMQVYKFQLTWFDNGVQHKDILVYVKCPDRFGKDFFTVGKTYIITAIPFMDSMKAGTQVSDQFPNETLERYMLLRIK